MKSDYIGVETNNLNNINISLQHNKIILLSGASGSGKSSLAISTIHKISMDELSQLMNLKENISSYSIKEYHNILPSIALLQENYNRNPKSTIATYFGIDIFFKRIFSENNSIPSSFFQFNSYKTSCPHCYGTGTMFEADISEVIEYNTKIKDIPFKNWKASYSDFYKQILQQFCKDNEIDIEKTFIELSEKNQKLLLYGIGDKKYKINYKISGRKRVKTSKYIGSIIELNLSHNPSEKDKKFYYRKGCSFCKGYRFSNEVLKYKVYEKNLGELYSIEIEELISWIKKKESKWKKSTIESISFNHILSFLKKMKILNLEHLNLNRAIPTLSGGELQRLRFSKSINSQFSNFLYILDEPSAGLHPSEWDNIKNAILKIKSKKNTIILIEHNTIFEEIADKIITLAVNEHGKSEIKKKSNIKKINEANYTFFETKKILKIKDKSFNNLKNISVEIPLESFVAICGKSGSGKTSFLKGILFKYLPSPIYLNQSPIKGNSYSIIGTYIGVFDEIKKLYSKEHKLSTDFFSFHHSSEGKCKICNGTGIVKEDFNYSDTICPECEGKRFNKKTLDYSINGLNIYEVLTLSMDELSQMNFKGIDKTKKIIAFFQYINLGHLSLFRPLSTLSGGEAQRVKLCSTFYKYKKSRTYLLDEPFRGLDINNKYKLIEFFYKMVELKNSIIVVEHDPIAIKSSSYIIEFGPGSGKYGGTILYSGNRNHIDESSKSIIRQYL